jgi:lipoyl(octanoyl) transferase
MSRRAPEPKAFASHFHLLGQVEYEDCLTAQKRLAYDAVTRSDGRLSVLLCEHPALITVGRRGSRDQLHLTGAELAERELTVRYVARGGGCLLHAPGQLAVYVITQLSWHRWSVGDYMRRLQLGLREALLELGVTSSALPGQFGLWGKSGLLAAMGVAVKFGVTSHGAFINVNPDMRSIQRVEAVPAKEFATLVSKNSQSPLAESGRTPSRPIHSSLLSETSQPVKMTGVRAAVVKHLSAAFGCVDHHLHTGHPLLAEIPGTFARESAA